QPFDSACPKPITRSPSGSRTPTANRVRQLPASSPTAYTGFPSILYSQLFRLFGRDAIVKPQIERCRRRRSRMNLRVMIEEILQAALEIAVAHHQLDFPPLDFHPERQILRVVDVHFGDLFGQRPQLLYETHVMMHAKLALTLALALENSRQNWRREVQPLRPVQDHS